VTAAQSIAPILTVQNWYNVAHRGDELLIASLNEQGVSYNAFWPLGGFNPLQSDTLDAIVQRLGATVETVAIAWLMHWSPNILVIPGTSKVSHLEENCAASTVVLSDEQFDALSRGA